MQKGKSRINPTHSAPKSIWALQKNVRKQELDRTTQV